MLYRWEKSGSVVERCDSKIILIFLTLSAKKYSQENLYFILKGSTQSPFIFLKTFSPAWVVSRYVLALAPRYLIVCNLYYPEESKRTTTFSKYYFQVICFLETPYLKRFPFIKVHTYMLIHIFCFRYVPFLILKSLSLIQMYLFL